MNFRKAGIAALAGIMLTGSSIIFSENTVAEGAAHPVNEEIFQWVQSSSRMGYYFNQQQICYKVVNNKIDFDTLIVPILKVYDPVQIKDTVDKRRWHMLPTHDFRDLAGRIELAELNISTRTAHVKSSAYVDSTWTTIESSNPDHVIELNKLSDMSLDKIFFSKVLDYAMRNQLELAVRTRSDLSQEVKDNLALKQEAYILATDPEFANKLHDEWVKLVESEANAAVKKNK